MTSPTLQAQNLIKIADEEGTKQDILLAIGYALIAIAERLEALIDQNGENSRQIPLENEQGQVIGKLEL